MSGHLAVMLQKTVRFVDVHWFVSHYTKDICAKQAGCRRPEEKLW